jgi:hypothetical protein
MVDNLRKVTRFLTKERTQLFHTGIATFAGAFLGAFLALFQSDCADRSAALKKLEVVRREAEANFDAALRIKDGVGVNAQTRSAALDRIDLAVVQGAVADERVVERLPAEILSLLVTYIRDGQMVIEMQSRHTTLAVEWAVVAPNNVAPGLKETGDSLRYNASVFAAESLVVGEQLAAYVDLDKFNSPEFKTARETLEHRVREVTQGVIDGRHERSIRQPRIEPSKP